MNRPLSKTCFPVDDYDLAATLNSGQTFRWERAGRTWESVVDGRWVKLAQTDDAIIAEASGVIESWDWLAEYLQVNVRLASVIKTFPDEEPIRLAVSACRGLRLLRQNPWECLASFILSSNKRILHIQQIIRLLCQRYGESVRGIGASRQWQSFPSAARLAEVPEPELRDCKMGYRAGYLKEAARLVAESEIDLDHLPDGTVDEARSVLMSIPGVGRKIADCVSLFSLGFFEAFPIDVWIMNGLRELYFRDRPVPLKRLQEFATGHFGPYGGYAQQYLFHFLRTRETKSEAA